MKYRDIVVGAIVTLLVSVLAGVVVWFLTHEQKVEAPSEKLQYVVEDVATFSADQTKIGFVTVKLENSGSKAARDVRLVLVFPNGTQIREKQVTSGGGPAAGGHTTNVTDDRKVEIVLPVLAPKEIITSSFLVAGTGTFRPEVGVRSAESIGVAGEPAKPSASTKGTDRLSTWYFFGVIVGALVIQAVPFLALVRIRRRQFERLKEQLSYPSKWERDTVFLFAHVGLVNEAVLLAEHTITKTGGEPLLLSNYALALALRDGDKIKDKVEALFRAAEWWTEWDSARFEAYEKAVLKFNRAVSYLAQNNFDEAMQEIDQAASKSSDVLEFLSISLPIKRAADESRAFADFVAAKKLAKSTASKK